jgi:acetylornithine deacetylase/succinyl-diaminopimelate desuccinylase-like protein
MKSGLVCALAAFKALIEDRSLHGKLGKIAFAATVDEEGLGQGARALLESELGRSAGILLTEPFGGDNLSPSVPLGLTGKVLYRLTVTGKMAHGFYPERGRNAVEAAGKIVAALDQLPLLDHPEYGRGNYAALKINGGYKEYAIVVPERCQVIITRLTVPGEDREALVADMGRLIDSLDLDCAVTIETPAPFYEPYVIDTDSRLANSFRQAYQATTGAAPEFNFLRGITDANIYVAEGAIPSISYGPAGGGAHECNEYVEIDTLVPVAQVLADSCINYFHNS